jgi:cell division septation protein DedD
MNKLLKLSAIAYSVLMLNSCGVLDSTSEDLQNAKTGVFLDSEVSGLTYKCSSGTSGVTNEDGEFTCEDGDKVAFYLDKNFLATVDMQDVVTPHTLFPDNDDAAINLAQILQTLDKNNDPKDGITIDEKILTSLDNIDIKSTSFDEDVQIKLGNDVVLVPDITATEHLNETLKSHKLQEIKEPTTVVVTTPTVTTTPTTTTTTTTTTATTNGPLTSPYTTTTTTPTPTPAPTPTTPTPTPAPSASGVLTSPYTTPS